VVGSGTLYRGHSDAPGACGGPTSVSLAAAADEAPYAGTGNSELELSGLGKEQRRTHRLRSGEWIWDLSGNVWEFTQTRRSELGLTTPALPGPLGDLWTPFTGFTGAERAAVGFTLAEGPETGGGQFFWTTDLSTDPPINRGGSYCPYGSLTNTGIFTASVRADLRTARLRDLGFRCVVQ
jgi:hypothetical protein